MDRETRTLDRGVSTANAHTIVGATRRVEGLPFRFDSETHTYIDLETGSELCHITGMLARTGWIDDVWFTEESSERGRCVHTLTADYDLGALDVATCRTKYRGWLLAHVATMKRIRHTWDRIEEPAVHPVYRFGGRPDRVGYALGLKTVFEVKSGVFQKSHQIQTALQAILDAAAGGLPAEHYQRLAEYLKPTGRGQIQLFKDRCDFDEAYRIIKVCCPC